MSVHVKKKKARNGPLSADQDLSVASQGQLPCTQHPVPKPTTTPYPTYQNGQSWMMSILAVSGSKVLRGQKLMKQPFSFW